jgi:hypothetical protein
MKFKIYTQKINRHLTDEEIARWVDAAEEDRVEELPERIVLHGEECLICKEKIIETSQSVMAGKSSEISEADAKYRRQFRPAPVIPLFAVVKVAVAACILIGIGTLMVHFLYPEKQDPAMLFAQNFKPYPDLITEKSSTWQMDTLHQLLASGLSFYRVKKFDSAYMVFNNLFQKNPQNDTISFYLANTILSTDSDPDSAITIFRHLSEKKTLFAETSQWYLAMALLKKRDYDGAKLQLMDLIKTSQYYREKAETIIKDLE